MKNKIKKILTTSLISAMTLTTIGAAGAEQISAKQTQKTNASTTQIESIQNAKTEVSAKGSSRHQVGKIVETALYSNDGLKTYTRSNGANYLADKPTTIEENLNANANGQMSLFVLSETPYITFSSDENNSRFNMFVNFTRTNNLAPTNIKETNNIYSSEDCYKRTLLTIYTNELCNGNITLSDETKTELENLLNSQSENSENGMSSIISILENNLSTSSPYYGKNLSNFSASQILQSSTNSQYKDLVNKIISTFNLNTEAGTQSNTSNQTVQNNQSTQSTNNSSTQTENNQLTRNISQPAQTQNPQANTTNQNTSTNSQTGAITNRNYQRNQNYYPDTNQTQNSTQTRNRRYFRNNYNNPTNNPQISYNQDTTNQSNTAETRTMRADRSSNIDYISNGSRFNNSARPRANRTPYTETQQTR